MALCWPFTEGRINNPGPKHYSAGYYRFEGDTLSAEAAVMEQAGSGLNIHGAAGSQSRPPTMFCDAGREFAMVASGIRPAADLIGGDVWIKENPDMRFLFKPPRLTTRRLTEGHRALAATDILHKCRDVTLIACAGGLEGASRSSR